MVKRPHFNKYTDLPEEYRAAYGFYPDEDLDADDPRLAQLRVAVPEKRGGNAHPLLTFLRIYCAAIAIIAVANGAPIWFVLVAFIIGLPGLFGETFTDYFVASLGLIAPLVLVGGIILLLSYVF